MSIRIRGGWLILLVSILLISLILLAVLIFNPLTSSYGISANTEKIEIEITDLPERRLVIDGADIYRSQDVTTPFKQNYSCDVMLTPGSLVSIERVGNGEVRLMVSHPDSVLFGEPGKEASVNGSKLLTIRIDSVDVRASLGESIFLPIEGKINIGQTNLIRAHYMSPALLRSGTISVRGISGWFEENFDAGKIDLQLGDQIIFVPQTTKAVGLVVVNEQPGLQASFWGNAKGIKILRPGSSSEPDGFTVEATRLDRILNGQFSQIVSIAFGALIIILTITTSLLDIIIFIRTEKQP